MFTCRSKIPRLVYLDLNRPHHHWHHVSLTSPRDLIAWWWHTAIVTWAKRHFQYLEHGKALTISRYSSYLGMPTWFRIYDSQSGWAWSGVMNALKTLKAETIYCLCTGNGLVEYWHRKNGGHPATTPHELQSCFWFIQSGFSKRADQCDEFDLAIRSLCRIVVVV